MSHERQRAETTAEQPLDEEVSHRPFHVIPFADPSCSCEGLGCVVCCGEALP